MSLILGMQCCLVFAQSAFSNASQIITNSSLLTAGGGVDGCGISYYDFNGDGFDDLTVSSATEGVKLFQNNGVIFHLIDSIPMSGEVNQVLWGDYDNDGDADLFISVYGSPCKLFNNLGNMELEDVSASSGIPQSTGFLSTGACWGDYDHDSFLDLYICNFNISSDLIQTENILLRNNGDGTFLDITMQAGVGNGLKQSFAAIWFDYNNDGWSDLYVINDRLFMANALYKNLGNGQFEDVSAATNTDISINAMTCTAGDFDNDGWSDLFISNGPPVGNVLLKNVGGLYFTDISSSAGIQSFQICWGGQWIDYDNDMFQDLYVGVRNWINLPTLNEFYVNNHDLTFSSAQPDLFSPPNDKVGWSNACGDFNDDGYWDLVQLNDNTTDFGMWLNAGGDNNYIKFSLTGTVSNLDGIGSRILCTAGGITQTLFSHAGEDYLSQDSQYEIFGLGDNEIVDNLTIFWPSGITDVYSNIAVNQTIHLIEGIPLNLQLSTLDNIHICEGDSVVFNPGEFDSYLWSNGSEQSSLTAFENDTIWLQVQINGYPINSDTVVISNFNAPVWDAVVSNNLCYGDSTGSIQLEFEDNVEVFWDNGASGFNHPNLVAETYVFEFHDILTGCTYTDSVMVTQPNTITCDILTLDALCFGEATGSASFSPNGGSGTLVVSEFSENLDSLFAGLYAVTISDDNGCSQEFSFEINEPDPLEVTLSETWINDQLELTSTIVGGNPPYNYEWSDGSTDPTLPNPDYDVYYVTVTDSDGCSNTSPPITISSVRNYDYKTPFISPNPVHDVLHFTNSTNSGVHWFIHNSTGRLVLQGQSNHTQLSVPVDHLSSGIYYLSIFSLTQGVFLSNSFIKN